MADLEVGYSRLDAASSYTLVRSDVTYAEVKSSTTYLDLSASEVVLDYDTKNRYFRDESVALGDASSFTLSKNLTDFVSTISDALQSIDVGKGATDAFSASDLIHVLLDIRRGFSDATVLGDTSTLITGINKYETLTVDDALNYSAIKQLSEAVPVSDASALLFDASKIDGVSTSDVFSRVLTYSRAFSDAMTMDDFTDVNAIRKDTVASKSNAIGFSDTQNFDTGKLLQDSAAVTELAALSTTRPATDSLSVTDAFLKNVSFSRAFTDAINFADNDTILFGKALSDTATMSEAFQKAVVFQRTFSDALNFADQSATAFGKNVSDTASLSELIEINTTSTASAQLNATVFNLATLNN
jgi:hypothetical protein